MPATTGETGGATARAPRDTARLFNDVADLYNRFTRILDAPETPINRWLSKHLGSGHRALDVGCGAGRYTIRLADRYNDVVGVDAAPAMIEVADRERSRPNIRYQARDVLSLTPERDGCFDLVLAIGCVSHIGPPQLALSHLRRLVTKGGTLLIMEPVWQAGWGSRDWQVDLAFRAARSAWEVTGDLDDVAVALQVVLSPMWLEVTGISVPLTREDLLREYSAALPGVVIQEGFDLLGIEAVAVLWYPEDEQ